MKYGIRQFRNDYPTDESCLELIFDTLHSRECSCGGEYHLIKGRKQYQCSKCRYQIAPTAGTIFHKSATPLSLWFYSIFIFAHAKSGISAKELERQLGVTYKTAWRILKQIRKTLTQGTDKLSGDVEMDGAMIGGRFRSGRENKRQKEAIAHKSVVMGAVERKGGRVRVKVVEDSTAKTQLNFIKDNVEKYGTRLMTDATNRLEKISNETWGYDRYSVNHGSGEFTRGDININTIETFWAHVKRSMGGTHKVISKKYLQSYLDGFAFHYNNRYNDSQRFSSLLDTLLTFSK